MKNQILKVFVLLNSVIWLNELAAQTDSKPDSLSMSTSQKNLSVEGYGAFNYYHFNWQTDSTKRNAIDNERFILELGYGWTDRIRLNTEIEFEHGGTGSAVEFDRFEEFGEFEFEIEKGGEVLVEQMNIEFTLNKNLSLKVGRLKVPFALAYEREEPTDYPTATYSEMESQILPDNWTENGIMVDGFIGRSHLWEYHAGIVNGLDGTAFNSANWVKRGNQKRFEMVNAENFAFCTRLDFKPSPSCTFGISAYAGNTTDNRPKPDLQVDAFVTMGEMHVMYQHRFAKINSMFLYGALSNSEALSNQNRNLSNNLNVKRTPVASAAIGGFFEIESASLINHKKQTSTGIIKPELSVYGRVDYYDTMNQTQGEIFNNPRWQRVSYTFGALLKIIDDVHLKTQYSIRKVGAPAPSNINGGTLEKTFVLGFAFEF
ncbi:MAG TPA: hypothetical protein VFG10_00600 [Saprospiraceae bacterium]|nr:hypothetical protein [Saprospiraceae bacterium]